MERVSDTDLVSRQARPRAAGRPVKVGWMFGRSRSYAGFADETSESLLSIAFNDDCDVVVALARLGDGDPTRLEPSVIAFLNSSPMVLWAKKELGLETGKRYSWGYGACPDLDDHATVFRLLPAKEALGMIFEPKNSPSLPKVILLDLNLGKMGGLHVLRRLKSDERTKSIPVVVLSGSKLAIEVIESYKLGVNSYVMKPSDGKKFGELVRGVVHYWLTINEVPAL